MLKERHVDIKLCKIKDNIKQGRIKLYYILGVDQPADGLTKALLKDSHMAFKTGVRVTKVSQVTQAGLRNYTTTGGTLELMPINLVLNFKKLTNTTFQHGRWPIKRR